MLLTKQPPPGIPSQTKQNIIIAFLTFTLPLRHSLKKAFYCA